jgi:iron complex outermembrane receptor protein
VITALFLAAATAATAPAPLDPVVVTATREEQPASEIPASIDAVFATEINSNKLGVNLSETLNAVPGVLVRDRQNYAQDQQISIRGFGTRAPFGIVGVRLFVDGIPASMPDGQGQVSHFNLDSADRIEVLRGPFSVLYGNASSGVIQIVTAPADERWLVNVGAAGGSFGALRSSLNLRTNTVGANVNADYTHFQTDGYRDHSSARRESGNLRAAWGTGTSTRVTLLGNVVSIPDAEDPQGVTRAQFDADPRQVAAPALTFNTRKSVRQGQLGLGFEQDFGEHYGLHAIGYYGQRDVEQFLSVPVAAQEAPTSSGGVVKLDNWYSGGDLRFTVRQDLLDRPFNVAAGLSYELQESDRRGYNNFVGETLGVQGELRRDEDNRIDNFSQYLQAQWDFATRWAAIVGARHDAVRFRSADNYIREGNPDDSGSKKYDATSPVAGVLFRAADQLRLYASYGRGFDTPTFVEIAYRPGGLTGLNTDLAAARSHQGELGMKWRFGSNAMSFVNAALFIGDTNDEILVDSAQGGRTTFRNAGKARREGAELQASFALHELLRWQVAYTFIEAELRPSDRPIPGVPRSNAFTALRFGGDVGWRTAVEATYTSRVPVSTSNDDAAPAFVLVGANYGYTWDLSKWRVTAFVRGDNLLNRAYVGSVIVNDANGRYYEPGPSRSFFGGIDLRWRI